MILGSKCCMAGRNKTGKDMAHLLRHRQHGGIHSLEVLEEGADQQEELHASDAGPAAARGWLADRRAAPPGGADGHSLHHSLLAETHGVFCRRAGCIVVERLLTASCVHWTLRGIMG